MRFALVVPALALLLGGCAGYKLGPSKPYFMQQTETIAVPSFKNNTLLPRMEVLAANCVIHEFQVDGTYKIVSENQADAVLEGTVVNVDRRPARSLRGNVLRTTEFDMNLTVSYNVMQRTTGKVLTQGTAIGTTSFFVTGDLQQDERQAFPLAMEKAAVQIVSQISEGWQKSESASQQTR